jgi:hypothetical protein
LVSRINETFIRPRYRSDMTAADSTILYLGWAALLFAVVMLRLSAKMRAGFFIAVILAAMLGGPSSRVEHVAGEIVAMTD